MDQGCAEVYLWLYSSMLLLYGRARVVLSDENILTHDGNTMILILSNITAVGKKQ